MLRPARQLFLLKPGRPAIPLGLRAAVAVTVPYMIASLARFPEPGWTGLTGLLVTLADRGGSYQGRARVMGGTALLGALVGAVAAPLGGRLLLDEALLLGGVFAASFLRCYGESEGSLGEKLAVIFVASLGAHAISWEAGAARGMALLFGGLWAMLQALVLWPFHPYLPARKAIARVYVGLAQGALDLARLTRESAPVQQWEAGLTRHTVLREHIEHAREVLAATRMGRSDEPRRGEYLLVLLEHGEPMMGMLFGITQAMEVAADVEHVRPIRAQVARLCERYAVTVQRIAAVVREPARGCDIPEPPREESVFDLLPGSVSELFRRMRHYERGARTAALAMQSGLPPPRPYPRLELRPGGRRRDWLEPLKANLRVDSLVLRHALRAAIVASTALLVTRLLHLGEAYWVVLSAIGILQPYSASTEERALARVLGTLVGGLLAAGLATAIHTPALLFLVIGVLTAVSVSLLPLNFGAFQMLLTPDFLLLATLSSGNWMVAEGRALGVLIACALALCGAWFLWPVPERKRFPEAAAAVLRADGRYLREVAHSRSVIEPGVGEARRSFGLALLEAEASFERLLAEYHGPPARLEPAMVVLTYSRRLAGSVTALGEQLPRVQSQEELEQVAKEAGGALDALADSLREGMPPPPMPELRRPELDDPVTGLLAERVPRQLEVLHGAVAKLSDETGLASAAS
ncbi:FUSC family protein [Myxococcaceae bacterium GXIMD 01537]